LLVFVAGIDGSVLSEWVSRPAGVRIAGDGDDFSPCNTEAVGSGINGIGGGMSCIAQVVEVVQGLRASEYERRE
jgi:hypothetical protein